MSGSDDGDDVEATLAGIAVSISEFMKNPAAVLREAIDRLVEVVDLDRAAVYLIELRLFEAMMEELADHDLYRNAASRLADKSCVVEVDVDDL